MKNGFEKSYNLMKDGAGLKLKSCSNKLKPKTKQSHSSQLIQRTPCCLLAGKPNNEMEIYNEKWIMDNGKRIMKKDNGKWIMEK